MVERVARAICLDRDPDCTDGGPHPVGGWLNEGCAWWTGYEDAARAAIEAMREPTPEMIWQGEQMHIHDMPETSALHAWKIMINEALK